MKNINTIKRFLSKDEIRPAFHNFYVNEGKLYATTAHHMIVTPTELAEGCYDRNLNPLMITKTKDGERYYKDANGNLFKRPNFESVLKNSYGKEQRTFEGCRDLLEKVHAYKRKDLNATFFKTEIGIFNAIYLKDIADIFNGSKNVTGTIGESYGRTFAPIFSDGETTAIIMPVLEGYGFEKDFNLIEIK